MSRTRNQVKIILLVVLAWLGTYGISYTCSIAAGDYFSYGIISLAVFAGVFVLLKYTWENLAKIQDKKLLKKRVIWAGLTALLFACSLIMGYQLHIRGMTESGLVGKGLIFIRSVCLAVSVLPFSNYLFVLVEKISGGEYKTDHLWKNRNVFLVSWLLIFLLWIPVFLAYYPAVMAYDFHRQSQEAVKGFIWFNSYQPLAHTWLIWLFLNIGTFLGSYETGMACYSIFQMLLLSVACGYSCVTLYRLVRRKWPVVLLVLFYGVFPLVSILSVGVTKDVPFTALFLIFICLFIERHFFSEGRKQKVIDVLWVLEGIVMMLFRNNAIYAMAVFTLFYLILVEKKQRVRILIMCLALVIGGKGALEGMQILIGTEGRGSKIEMMSVPIQQFGRVGYYHGDEIEGEIFEILDKYVPQEHWHRYNPPLSDSLKNWLGGVYANVWEPDLPQMLSDWVKVGLKYPNEYIDAFLLLTKGYWFIDDKSWADVFGYGLEGRMGALSTYTSSTSEVIPEGIAHETKMPALEAVLENIVSANCFYEWPVISNLFKPALYCWILLLTVAACIYIGHKKKILVTLFPLIYLATMFLGPVVQVRYALPIMVIVPLMLGVFATKTKVS